MLRNIIHLIPRLEQINFGIWNAAIFAADYIHQNHHVLSQLWVWHQSDEKNSFALGVNVLYLDSSMTSEKGLSQFIDQLNLNTSETVFVSHGCWQAPSRLGYRLRQRGFVWISAPHGMLEPWSMQHKRWKKFLYFSLFEKRLLSAAHGLRAVSKVEQENLQQLFNREVFLVENGVTVDVYEPKSKSETVFLFMSRLHHKKGIVPFVKTWINVMSDVSNAKLIIAGPDEGELNKIKPFLNHPSIEYVGAVYNEKKRSLLRRSHYFVLPSYSEGFPTSVVEAMSYGLIPLISAGCNFPAVFTEKLGYRMEPDQASISTVLTQLKSEEFNEQQSRLNHSYVQQHNSEASIGQKLFEMYQSLIQRNSI